MHATISHTLSSLSRTNQQQPLFNSPLITPLLFPWFYFSSIACIHAAAHSYKTPHLLPSSSPRTQQKDPHLFLFHHQMAASSFSLLPLMPSPEKKHSIFSFPFLWLLPPYSLPLPLLFFMRATADGHLLIFSPSTISHGRPLHISYLHLLLLHQNRVPMTPWWIGFCCSSNLGTHEHRRFSMVSCRKSPDAHPTWHLCSSCLPLDLLCMPQIVPRESCCCFIGTLFLWQCHHHQLLLALTKRQGRPFLFFL